jgi:RNA recognition motif-containing protein
MNIYVGNLSFDTTDATLRAAFEAHGEVVRAEVVMDRDTGRSRGFGFVEMPSDTEAQAAIEALNGSQLDGRTLNVDQARPRGGSRGSSRSW